MIGAKADVIDKAEDREQFKEAMKDRPGSVPRAAPFTTSQERAMAATRSACRACCGRASRWAAAAAAIAYNRERIQRAGRAGSSNRPVTGADRGIGHRLERIRAGGDARQGRQRRHHLLDREPRPDGRPHRRLDHGGPGADADRQGIPADARRPLAMIREIGVETGGSNIQFAINPADGRMIVIEMNPRVSRSSATGVKSDRFPDRQDRGQAGGRLSPARAAERHHSRNHGLFRADNRLRGDESAAIRLRKVSRRGCDTHDADEERRRDDGDRQHVQRIVPEGAPRPGGRQRRLRLRSARYVGHGRAAERGGDHRKAEASQAPSGLVFAICVQERHERGEGL